MAQQSQIPWFLPWANRMVKTLLRAGVPLNGPGKVPMYLLTVPGRKSGLPRSTPVALIEHDGKRYLYAPYGVVDWVRNLRAAGEATFTRGRISEQLRAVELPLDQARPVLERLTQGSSPILRLIGITRGASPEEIEGMLAEHPLFQLQSATTAAPTISEAA